MRTDGLAAALVVGSMIGVVLPSCAPPEVTQEGGSSGGAAGRGSGPGRGGDDSPDGPSFMLSDAAPTGSNVMPCPNDRCSDFPAAPLMDDGVPGDAASRFGGGASGAGPCLLEPESGSLFPQKWLRPRIKWTGSSGLHRITIHAEREEHDLVAYTTKSSWAMPKDLWEALGTHVVEEDITVTVRAADGGESVSKFQIAPVTASGSMVFWSVPPNEAAPPELRGFGVGDESTVTVLKPAQVKQPSADENGSQRPVQCIGCHVATPDDGFVAFVDDWPWNVAIAGVKPTNVGEPLPGLSDGGLASLNLPWGGMMAFSRGEWSPGRRRVLLASSLRDYAQRGGDDSMAPGKLVWYSLDAPAPMSDPNFPGQAALTPGVNFGEVAREGDPGGAACPAWSNDARTVIYASTMGGNRDGALVQGATDLYSVPWNGGKGGAAKRLEGASDSAFEEYYPAISPDDRLVIFTRVPAGERMDTSKLAEVAVLPVTGGKALRLAANDPPACSGKSSPGINNHWGKWAPAVQAANGRTYYWLLFSSTRADIPAVPRTGECPNDPPCDPDVAITQLYMSVVVDDGHGLKSYPAIYLWNQPTDTLNMTPIWENLSIPRVVD